MALTFIAPFIVILTVIFTIVCAVIFTVQSVVSTSDFNNNSTYCLLNSNSNSVNNFCSLTSNLISYEVIFAKMGPMSIV